MSWFKENPFLGALATAALGLLVGGGVFLSSEMGRLEEQQMAFDQKTAELQQLELNQPFPDQTNVDAAKKEDEEARTELEILSKGLAVIAPSATPQSFQDELAKLVQDTSEKATAKNIVLPAEFYLGFEKYKTQLPSADIAPKLTLQLRSIHAVVSVLLDAPAKSLGRITRAPVEGEESGGEQPEADSRNTKTTAPALEIADFDVTFIAEQSSFRSAFNRIVELDPPVFVRLVAIENSAPGPLPKSATTADVAPASPPSEEPIPEAENSIKPVVGRETISVSLRLASVIYSVKTPSP